jgi:hypothetical protein
VQVSNGSHHTEILVSHRRGPVDPAAATADVPSYRERYADRACRFDDADRPPVRVSERVEATVSRQPRGGKVFNLVRL